MSAFKRYATVAYARQNSSILSIEKISPPQPVTYNASDYLNIFSRFLTTKSNNTAAFDVISVAKSIMDITWILELYHEDYRDDPQTPVNFLRDMLMIPIQFSTAVWLYANVTTESIPQLAKEGLYALPSDLETIAYAAHMTPRVMATPWTVYVFMGVSSALYLWGASALYWMLRQQYVPPITSSFMEVDISSKLTSRNIGGLTSNFSSLLQSGEIGNAGSSNIAKGIKGKRLQVRALWDRERDERHTVLIVVDEDATRRDDIELRKPWKTDADTLTDLSRAPHAF